MNIFNALSQGKGRLNEENLSAMLGFLLNPKNEHGLSDLFLKRFMKIVCSEIPYDFDKIFMKNYALDITFESPYDYNGKRRRIDLDLKFYIDDNEILRLLIENKIRTNAADEYQLYEEYMGVVSNLEDDDQFDMDVIVVFLTHSSEDEKLRKEYDALAPDNMNRNHFKRWIYWDDSSREDTVTHELKRILFDENMMIINPISEYIRHTIKAFVCFIQDNMIAVSKNIVRHNPLDNDTIKEQHEFILKGKTYSIEWYKSNAIKIYEVEIDEYVPARPILRELISEYDLEISVMRNETQGKTTRQLGREIISQIDKIRKL